MPDFSRLLVVLAVAAVLPSSVHAAAPPLSVPAPVAPGPRAQLETLARDAFVSTRVEGPRHAMRPDVFDYLLDHPDFASHVTRGARPGPLPDLARERRAVARRRVGHAGHVHAHLRGARGAPLPRARRL